MSMTIMLNFLKDLEQNNNREWFQSHKGQYQEAKDAFANLVQSLLLSLREKDKALPLVEPQELTFKLMRDTRFSHDKSPYNPAFRAHIGPRGKLPIPVGYYIMIRPNNRSFLGGGLFADMFKEATTMVREQIATDGDNWQRIISEPGFQKNFTVRGTSLKNVPKGYDPSHPQGEFLKNKSWYLEYPVSDQELLKADFIPNAVAIFLQMRPFNQFLNNALRDFQMPAR